MLTLETVFQYRTLVGKCELGVGLGWEEIEAVTQIEARFENTNRDGRRFRRETVKMSALLRGNRIHDRVDVIELGPGGLVVRNAPYVAKGELVELIVELGDQSFRFSARGVWLKDDHDDFRVGLMFVGMPVCLNNVVLSRPHEEDVVEKIAVAA
jgi:hypothetical protein